MPVKLRRTRLESFRLTLWMNTGHVLKDAWLVAVAYFYSSSHGRREVAKESLQIMESVRELQPNPQLTSSLMSW
jgi:hypothetical protein